jgi:DNA-binding CsgD family transcriptional regulator
MGVDQIDALSDLEKEALRLFLVVSDQKELARRIGRSPATVEQRLARARRKLGSRAVSTRPCCWPSMKAAARMERPYMATPYVAIRTYPR